MGGANKWLSSRVWNIARIPVTSHGSREIWNPVTVKVNRCPFGNGLQVGESGMFWPQYPSLARRYRLSWANGSSSADSKARVTGNRSEPRTKKAPGGVATGTTI